MKDRRITIREYKKCFYMAQGALMISGAVLEVMNDISLEEKVSMDELYLCCKEQFLRESMSDLVSNYLHDYIIRAWRHFGRDGLRSYSLRGLKREAMA